MLILVAVSPNVIFLKWILALIIRINNRLSNSNEFLLDFLFPSVNMVALNSKLSPNGRHEMIIASNVRMDFLILEEEGQEHSWMGPLLCFRTG